MSDHVSIERMNEALDGVLSTVEAEAIEAHVLECSPCRNEYARLSEIVKAVRALPRSAATPQDVWAGVSARISTGDRHDESTRPGGPRSDDEATVVAFPNRHAAGHRAGASLGAGPAPRATGVRTRTLALSFPQLAAAAAAIAMVSAATVFIALGGGSTVPPEMAEAEPAFVGGGAAARAVSLDDDRYAEVVGQLERILSEGRDVLAPETLVTIEQSLRTVDEAIADVELALATDPNSDLLRRMLSTHQRTRLGVLQRAAAAVQAQT